jgi:hypothetical protein
MRAFCCVLLTASLSHSLIAQSSPTVNQNTGDVALHDAHLPAQVKNDIVTAIANHFQDMPDEPSGRTIALSSWVSRLQLAPTGPAAIVVTGGPDDYDNGATGNGDIWLFRQVGNHAVLVLTGGGFSYRPASKTYHNGMLDIQTAWNMSCCEGGIEVYRFDGHQYKPAYCYGYTSDEDGNMKFGPHERCRD